MDRAYRREDGAGPSLEAQQMALQRAGITDFGADGPVYTDAILATRGGKRQAVDLPQRALAIRSLRVGDRLLISSADRLGRTLDDVLTALDAIITRKASVYAIAEKWEAGPATEARDLVRFAQGAESGLRKQRAAKARKARHAGIRERGGSVRLTGKALEAARRDWFDLENATEELAQKHKASVRTLYRLFGPRETPALGMGANR